VKNQLIAEGKVRNLSINGQNVTQIYFNFDGPMGDIHSGMTRTLDGHDGSYIATSDMKRGHTVFNWRTWTAVSHEEVIEIEDNLLLNVPPGILLENLNISGIPGFSQLAPTSRLVFPVRLDGSQLVLAVWEQNGPCDGVGKRLQELHKDEPRVSTRFIASAQQKRGLMGFVLSEGYVKIGDSVRVYPPAG